MAQRHGTGSVFPVSHVETAGMIPLQLFCGPAAVSILTGRTAECAGAWINYLSGRESWGIVEGTVTMEVLATLRVLGYRPRAVPCRAIQDMPTNGRYLCASATHWFVVSGGRVYCSQNPRGRAIADVAGNPEFLAVEAWTVRKVASPVHAMEYEPMPADGADGWWWLPEQAYAPDLTHVMA